MHKKIALIFAAKKFTYYLLFFIPACGVLSMVGIIFGAPSYLLAALFLTLRDTTQIDLENPPPIFQPVTWILLGAEIICVALIYYFMGISR